MDDYLERAERSSSGEPNRDVDTQFREIAGALMEPGPNECIVCFLMRAGEFLLPTGFDMVERFRACNAPRATRLENRLRREGAHSDIAVVQGAAVVNTDFWEPDLCPDCGQPQWLPECMEVRRGSTQPCRLWRWQEEFLIVKVRRMLAERPARDTGDDW